MMSWSILELQESTSISDKYFEHIDSDIQIVNFQYVSNGKPLNIENVKVASGLMENDEVFEDI